MNSPAPWNYLWKPGPYPETEEARVAAAKKYGLIIEDYKPYPKGSDVMAGDYPDLPLVPEVLKDRMYAWDWPEYRRDYGEPVHENWWNWRETRNQPDDRRIHRMTLAERITWLFSAFLILGVGFYVFEYHMPRYFRPVMGAELLSNGPHYTFEPADE